MVERKSSSLKLTKKNTEKPPKMTDICARCLREESPRPREEGDHSLDDWIQCEHCDKWYHTWCLLITVVPEGSWHCHECPPLATGASTRSNLEGGPRPEAESGPSTSGPPPAPSNRGPGRKGRRKYGSSSKSWEPALSEAIPPISHHSNRGGEKIYFYGLRADGSSFECRLARLLAGGEEDVETLCIYLNGLTKAQFKKIVKWAPEVGNLEGLDMAKIKANSKGSRGGPRARR